MIAAGMKEVDLQPSDSELELDEPAQMVAESAPHQAEVHNSYNVADQTRSILGSSYYRPEQGPKQRHLMDKLAMIAAGTKEVDLGPPRDSELELDELAQIVEQKSMLNEWVESIALQQGSSYYCPDRGPKQCHLMDLAIQSPRWKSVSHG